MIDIAKKPNIEVEKTQSVQLSKLAIVFIWCYICCLFVHHLYIVYLVSDDLIIDSQQVVYISLNIFLERITNH